VGGGRITVRVVLAVSQDVVQDAGGVEPGAPGHGGALAEVALFGRVP
jgi:hypothetical protein